MSQRKTKRQTVAGYIGAAAAELDRALSAAGRCPAITLLEIKELVTVLRATRALLRSRPRKAVR